MFCGLEVSVYKIRGEKGLWCLVTTEAWASFSQGSLGPGEELGAPLAFVDCDVGAFQIRLRRKRLPIDLEFSKSPAQHTSLGM